MESKIGQKVSLFMHTFPDIPRLEEILKNVLSESKIGELCKFRTRVARYPRTRQNVHFEITLLESGSQFIEAIESEGSAKLIYLPEQGEKPEKFWRVKFDNNPMPPPFPPLPPFPVASTQPLLLPQPLPMANSVLSGKRARGSDGEISETISPSGGEYAELKKYAITLENAVKKLTEENRELIVQMYYSSKPK
jgi:hypothetical protein